MTVSAAPRIRNSNLELLRIVSMIMIIICHSSTHGGFNLPEQALTFNKIFLQAITFGGELGVCCFILITGYFMINSQFKLIKLLKLVCEVLFYSIGIMLIFYLCGFAEFDTITFLKSLAPITHSLYWFVTCYVMLYILSPFINTFLKSCTQKKHLIFILVLFAAGSLITSLFLGTLVIANLGLFVLFYAIAAYIRLYPNACRGLFSNGKKAFVLFLSIFALYIISVLIFDIIGLSIPLVAEHATHFNAVSSPLIICAGICLFLTFKNINMKPSRIINQTALSVFGVYLIHDNPFIRHWLWIDFFHNAAFLNSPYLVVIILGIGCLVFVCCTIIDQIRIFVLERPLFRLIDKFCLNHADGLERLKENCSGWLQKWMM